MIYFTADEHYYHSNILMFREGKESRKFASVDKMNRHMINQHNAIVTHSDTVYHLGDFYLGKDYRQAENILKQLNGVHILILGNHDLLKPFDYVEMGFGSVHTSLELVQGNLAFINSKLGGIKYPYLIHDPAAAGVFVNQYFIHGHTHGLGLKLAKNTFCVSVELHDYAPVPINKIKFGDMQ